MIGCGNIGTEIARAVDKGVVRARLVALYDIEPGRCRRLASGLERERPLIAESLGQLLGQRPDLVVEAASQEAVRQYGEQILKRGIDLVVLSVGALLDSETRERLRGAAEATGARIHVPSGAVAGLDALKSMSLVGVDRLVLRTRKPPRALAGAPGARGVDLEGLREPRLIYRGPASEAVKLFPANVNIAAALALAAGREPLVEIVADPTVDRNIHEVEAESKASRLHIVVENVPSPRNPRTSYLAVLSIIDLLRSLTGSVYIIAG